MAEAIDIVCGMTVDTETASHTEYQGETYYFCCDGCKGAFEKAAEYYVEEWEQQHREQA
jgi:YHS domain-containing protein